MHMRFESKVWLAALMAMLSCAAPQPPVAVSAPKAEPLPRAMASAAPVGPTPAERTWLAAKAVLDARCVVCHGCYDAPCQLILGSHEGATRGASKAPVYDGSRLLAVEPTRLFIDARTEDGWRKKDFFSVLTAPRGESAEASLMLRLLNLKREHPLPEGQKLPSDITLGMNRKHQCANASEIDRLVHEHPSWGMPYGLPPLSDQEHQTLKTWLDAGAQGMQRPGISGEVLAQVERWDAFFNDRSLKGQLVARYIYEHLFLASLYFEGSDDKTVFRLVRSATPPGQALAEIPTRRPVDDPGKTFFYRLVPQDATVLSKTNMPYALSDGRLERYRELFITPDYPVTELPTYDPSLASNPFVTFKALPIRARYRFMLDEAQFTLMGFIKGPVCRGQVALNVIQDRFWVTFIDPDLPLLEAQAEFLANVSAHLDLPIEKSGNGHLAQWMRYARHQKQYLKSKSEFLSAFAQKGAKATLNAIWDGEGKNPNAALTVLRHYDSATVAQGLLGAPPKTAWVIGYPLLERIHYLLVADFDVFGNVGHQLTTRLYMDFLRMEAESNFLAFLPQQRRRQLVDAWYRGTRGAVKDEVYGSLAHVDEETGIAYQSSRPELELFAMLGLHLSAVNHSSFDLRHVANETLRSGLAQLSRVSGTAASLMTEDTFLEVIGDQSLPLYFTLLRDTAHTNVAHLFHEEERHKPSEDRMTVVNGFLGSYPNTLFIVHERELSKFAELVENMRTPQHYLELFSRFGVRRTSPSFWPLSDRMREAFARTQPEEAGLFDYNRLEDP